jgi:hypothetical protein
MTTRTCIAAMRIASGSSVTLAKKACLERTGGQVFASQECLCPQKREAERRTAHHGCRASMGRRGRGPINKRTARLSALLRGHAPGFLPTRPGPRFLESPDANGRTLSGTSAASTSQSDTCRTGRCQGRLQAKSDELRRRNRTRSVSRRHRLTSLTMNGMDAVIQIRARAVKGFSIYADKSRCCAERLPLRASPDAFHSTSKIRKSEVVPVNQGFLCCANLCAAARRRPDCAAAGGFPLVPANAGTQSRFPRARQMSRAARRMDYPVGISACRPSANGVSALCLSPKIKVYERPL